MNELRTQEAKTQHKIPRFSYIHKNIKHIIEKGNKEFICSTLTVYIVLHMHSIKSYYRATFICTWHDLIGCTCNKVLHCQCIQIKSNK
jgi:hypothetical protein